MRTADVVDTCTCCIRVDISVRQIRETAWWLREALLDGAYDAACIVDMWG
jgi:hypothetical protein